MIAALMLASFHSAADKEEITGPMDENGVIIFQDDGQAEPAPDPAIQGTHTQYCADAREIAEAVTKLRDQGAPATYSINILVKQGQQQFVWVAKQAYWRQSESSGPLTVGADVWLRCQREGMNYSK